MKTADAFPAFKDGLIVIDDRDAPSLRNAIGSRIYRRRSAANGAFERACVMLSVPEMQHIKVVPVDGKNSVFALDYIDDGDCVVSADGAVRVRS